MKRILISIVLVATLAQINAQLPTADEVDEAIFAITATINSWRTTVGGENKAADLKQNKSIGADLPFIAGFLRLTYHDCLGEGGCDGCLDLQNPGNKGVDKSANILNKLYDDNNGYGMSRADFYALAGWTAVQVAPVNKGDKGFLEIVRDNGIEFEFGRQDCSTSPEEDVVEPASDFPSSCFNYQQSVDFFEKDFDFTPEETVAIMGAHSIGFIRHGLKGNKASEWVPGGGCSSRMNKKLYTKMLNKNLRPSQKKDPNGLCLWKGSGTFLDSDVSLAYDFTRNSDGKVTCSKCDDDGRKTKNLEDCCEKAPGFDQIQQYKNDNTQFLNDFAMAFRKMLSRNNGDLEPIPHEQPIKVLTSRVARNTGSKRKNRQQGGRRNGNNQNQRRRSQRKGDSQSHASMEKKEIDINRVLDEIEDEIMDIRNEISGENQ